MSFKDMVEADVKNVFLNVDEFAESHTVMYDGVRYDDIPIVLTKVKERERPAQPENLQGVHLVTTVAHISVSDLRGVIPEQNTIISISDGVALGKTFFRKYRIASSDNKAGIVTLELEAFDE